MACLDTMSADCSNCTNSGTQCTKCINNKFLSALSHICIDECEDTYCGDFTTFQCKTNSITNCKECKEGGN